MLDEKLMPYLNKINLGDSLEVMKNLPDNCIDLVLTDPPYGINVAKSFGKIANKQGKNNAAKKGNYSVKDWDEFIPDEILFNEIQRISKNAIIFGGNYFNLPPSPCWIVWDKNNEGTPFADCELAWTNYGTAVRKLTFTWNGMIQGDMMNKEERIHPTQKPRQLFRLILEKYLPDGGLVFDGFSGSGTTALACHDLGYDFICIEKDEEYHAASVKRLEEHQKQGRLF